MPIQFDWTINLGSVLNLLFLLSIVIGYGRKVFNHVTDINKKVNIMWIKFSQDNPEIVSTYEKLK